MKNRYVLELYDADGDILQSRHECKTLKEINEMLPDLEYHQVRSILRESTSNKKKFLHGNMKALCKRVRISPIETKLDPIPEVINEVIDDVVPDLAVDKMDE